MVSHADRVLRHFEAIGKVLEGKGFPATSPWWAETIRSWYLGGKRQLTVRAGRRAGKSSTFCRLAVAEALYGLHKVPPGDVGVVAIISTRKEEATERLRTIMAILDALGRRYRTEERTIVLLDRPVIFRVYTASVTGVSGFTGIFVFCDEVAKWKDIDTGTNPAKEVLRSVRPTLATQPNGRIVLSSSPMGTFDAHYDTFEKGETELQTVACAPTWVANPTLTEETTRQLEPDELFWAREYGAIPQSENERSLLSATLLQQAKIQGPHEPDDRLRYVAAIDPATRGNSWTLAVATQEHDQVRHVVFTKEWRGTRQRPLVPGAVFDEIRNLLLPFRLKLVHSDQWAGDALKEIAQQRGILLNIEPWTQALKADAYEGLKGLLQEGRLRIPSDPQVEEDLLGIVLRLSRHGETYELIESGARHSDFAPAVAMAVMFARVRAVRPAELLTVNDMAQRQKTEYLLERERERKRAERFGQPPVTHRRWSVN